MTIPATALILFLIMDPLGNLSVFLRILEDVAPKRRLWVILREMLLAVLTMLIFCAIGDLLLDVLGISDVAVTITSGIILFIAAIKILFPKLGNIREQMHANGEPILVPLAIPLIAGPSLLATIMLFAHGEATLSIVIPAIGVAWSASLLILLSGRFLYRWLGENGLLAAERVMGMVLILMAIQRFLEGIRLFVESYPIT